MDNEYKGGVWILPRTMGVYEDEICEYIKNLFPDASVATDFDLTSNINIHTIIPDKGRHYFVLWTSGISDYVPKPSSEMEDVTFRTEIVMFLPEKWDLGLKRPLLDPKNLWPLAWIRNIAQEIKVQGIEPVQGDCFTIEGAEKGKVLGSGTKMNSLLLTNVYPAIDSPPICPLMCKDGEIVQFLCAKPMYQKELDYIEEYGLDSILFRMPSSHIVDTTRKPYF